MITLTTPIVQQNVTRIELVRLALFDDLNIARVTLAIRSPPAGNRALQFDLIVRNGVSDKVRAKAAPASWDDAVERAADAVATATGYDTIEAAYSGASKAARKRAVEQALLTLAVIDASLAGTVS